MLSKKSIFETLAALGTSAILAGCGGSQAPVDAKEVPAAKESAPAAAKEEPKEEAKEEESSDATAAAKEEEAKTEEKTEEKAESKPAASPKPAAKPAAAGTQKKAQDAKGAGSCGQGTCG